jgi:TPR repeat protein
MADQGDSCAQLSLGIVYEDGNGLPRDYAKALTLFRLAANQGNPLAYRELGVEPVC